jgi:hypothetical protein
MASIKDYAETEFQKDLISQVLRVFPNIASEEYEEITEMVATKINDMNKMREAMNVHKGEQLDFFADQYKTTPQNILDSFVYFVLIVENVILNKSLMESMPEEE